MQRGIVPVPSPLFGTGQESCTLGAQVDHERRAHDVVSILRSPERDKVYVYCQRIGAISNLSLRIGDTVQHVPEFICIVTM